MELLHEDYGNPDDDPDLPKVITDSIDTLADACSIHWPVWQME